ncbi:asparaginase domain-containing protein [Nitrosophilus kaiyonis]|uniref:asparaginase domain-containing protein n=1 Tax=Nitrosophilus kaiyonis TaxID=2930200 RepID=UPI0024921C42|nr:asparaginase domain-containing protein [Nitrosophilus kaiyonis]
MITIINTGGTFNKRYDPVIGKLIVPKDNLAVEKILEAFCNNFKYELKGIIFKDSLDMDEKDREILLENIKNSDSKKIIVIHGTDTMDKSAEFVAKNIKDKCIVFTGAMKPFSINQVEATANFTLALSKILLDFEEGVFIAMHSLVLPYNKIYKNRKIGKFTSKSDFEQRK